VEFDDLADGTWASIREFGVHADRVESSYYDVTYDYRLRWHDVLYEPGELKAVAYKEGQPIGEATVRTAGEPAQLKLTPDRTQLRATGDDLCYVLVEALDADGALCPLAMNTVRFVVDGPSVIAAVGNGNPLSLEPFQADRRQSFYGKAMLILRTDEGEGGPIQIVAEADGMAPATAEGVALP
jgi:beta-galactosidase